MLDDAASLTAAHRVQLLVTCWTTTVLCWHAPDRYVYIFVTYYFPCQAAAL